MAAFLLLSTSATMTAAHVLPRPTDPVDALSPGVSSWPPAPTVAFQWPNELELRRRQAGTICGYIGGDPNLPATCLPGSHCAVDIEHGAIGCCPDGGSCKDGIFTGCVDRNSGPQTVADPYIFTCRGGNVCYKNVFEGGYSQYGCGSASDLATTVALSASGKPPLALTPISVDLTATPTPLPRPSSLGLETTATSSGSGAPSSEGSDSETPAASSQGPKPSSTGSGDAAPSSDGSKSRNSGAIVGGIVGGVAFLFALAALFFVLRKRKWSNDRRSSKDSVDPHHPRLLVPGNPHFEPYASRQEVSEAGIRHSNQLNAERRSSDDVCAEFRPIGTSSPHPHHLDTEEEVPSRDGHQSGESDRVPLTRGLDEFSRGLNPALEPIDDDPDAENHSPQAYPGPRRGGQGGVLWHQNRRRSRNLV
ncbi:hypothetical protein UVI_02006350 [Ustilaginoidea virens]|nr:hypothetical protein UVI_02006350 [Ustilaginoidea virens]